MATAALTSEFAQKISSWRHNSFQVYCGRPVEADEALALHGLKPQVNKNQGWSDD